MSKRDALRRLPVVTMLMLMLGCTPNPPVLAEDANLILRGPEGEQVCAGTFARSSAEIELIRASFRPSSGPIEYVWLREADVEDKDFPCSSSDYACTRETTIYSRTLGLTHEFVHAARSPGLPRILEEGLATMLDEPNAQVQELAARADFEEAFLNGSWIASSRFYERAAHFMSFLVAWGGWEAIRELENAFTSREDAWFLSADELNATFLAVYGVGLTDILTEYESYPDCAPAQFHQPLSTCALLESDEPPTQTIVIAFGEGDGTHQALLAVDCDEPSAYGPIDRGPLTIAKDIKVNLDNPLANTVRADLIGDPGPGATVWLSNCGDCWLGSGILVSSQTPSAIANMGYGPHVLTVHQAVDVPGELGLELSY